MPSLSFAKTMRQRAPTQSLRYMLHSHLSGHEEARPLKNVHASSLTKAEGFCPRYYALHDALDMKPKDNWLTTSEVVTFKMGNDLQEAVVNYFADMGKAIGHWRCLGCDHLQEFCKRPSKCTKCGCKAYKPVEVRFVSAKTGASCGIDMLVSHGAGKLVPVELKTIDKDQFKALLAPLGEHRLRTNLYLRLIEESGHHWANLVDTQTAYVLYVSKGGFGCAAPDLRSMGLSDSYSPFKEFAIKRDDHATEEVSRRALVVKQYRSGEQGMPCGICPTGTSVRAQKCSIRKQCWSGDHPPVYDWTK